MQPAPKYIPHYTFDDWLHWEGKWELIEGVPVAMSPSPMPEHQRVSSELATEIILALRKSGCKEYRAYLPIDYKISDDTIFEPDILVVCGKITKSYLDFPPSLVVEILSKSTEDKDRSIKYDYYKQEGVKYYLIVDVKNQQIEIYELVDGRYQLQPHANRFQFQLKETGTISVEFDNVWA